MAVTYERCSCDHVLTIPRHWTVYACGTCGQVYERDGTIWFPRREAKVGAGK